MAGRPRRKLAWVKMYIDEGLDGSTREELKPDERSVWWDFLMLAGRYNDDGNIPLTDSRLCAILNVTPALLARSIAKCVQYEKVERTEHGIHVCNFVAYQTRRDEEFRDKERNSSEASHSVAFRSNSSNKTVPLKETEQQTEQEEIERTEQTRAREGDGGVVVSLSRDDGARGLIAEGVAPQAAQQMAAAYAPEKVRDAIAILREQNPPAKNPTGLAKQALKEGWRPNAPPAEPAFTPVADLAERIRWARERHGSK